MARTVVITGTSTGIGRAAAERMAAEGWTVYAGVRSDADADRVKNEVAGDVRPVLLDVTNGDHIAALVATLGDELGDGGLDGLVNNAGVAEAGPVETVSDEEWRWHFEVNVFGLVSLTRACLPLLRAGKGRVVNVGSIAGRVASPLMAPYSAGKHAVEAISESLRFEVADFGMHVSCVEPGEIKTAIWAKGDDRMAQLMASLDADTIARYDRHIDTMHGFLADGAKRGIPASKVSDVIHHALTASRPKHRYLVGADAKMAGIASHLPDRLRARALSSYSARWTRAGRKLRAR
ncbi:MAG TPA: SDR family oxidoreductase [Acidimicrobiales bacterium]|nr:SDR family oxidoreductase [Acidimicrobiales bacterium]